MVVSALPRRAASIARPSLVAALTFSGLALFLHVAYGFHQSRRIDGKKAATMARRRRAEAAARHVHVAAAAATAAPAEAIAAPAPSHAHDEFPGRGTATSCGHPFDPRDHVFKVWEYSVEEIEVNETTLAFDAIDEVVHGDGHFLGQAETLQRMQSDFIYPEIGDRRTIDEWEADGSRDIRDVARDRTRRILHQHYPQHLGAEVDSKLRTEHDIRLPQETMRD